MPSRIYMICDRYESGYGHGLKNDGLDLSKTPHGDPEMGEAYQIGYDAGQEKYRVIAKANGGILKECLEMQVELEALRKDSARYRWALPILTGSDSDAADVLAIALAMQLMKGLDGDAAIDTAILAAGTDSTG